MLKRLQEKTVRVRFVVAVLGNGIRAAANFSAGLMITRALGAGRFGTYSFLAGSFNSLRPLLILGASSAFFTLISRGRRNTKYVHLYIAWLTLQFAIVLLLIGLLLPNYAYDRIWLGYHRPIVMLAFAASFMQMQAWPTVMQVGESKRETLVVQSLSAAIALLHLVIVGLLVYNGGVSVAVVLWCLIGEYTLAVGVGSFLVARRRTTVEAGLEPTYRSIVREYLEYGSPLALSTIAAAAYLFGDTWMLQRFGGSINQGLYQAAYQFAAISLFATTSILQVLWKELADAFGRKDTARVFQLYSRIARIVFAAGAVVSGFLIPWANELVRVMLGASFEKSGIILALLFIYPIHQALGQVTDTLALAIDETPLFSKVTIGYTAVSLVVSYLVLAPRAGLVPGLALGPTGLAVKIVCLNILSVNTLGYLIARRHQIRFEWGYQVMILIATVVIGYLAKALATAAWPIHEPTLYGLLGPFATAGVMFIAGIALLAHLNPSLVGATGIHFKKLLKITG